MSEKTKRERRSRCLLYIVAFIIFQAAVIAIFALTVMKVKTPKLRVHGATFTNINTATGALQATMLPQFTVKNTNFGRYKYQPTTVDFFYGNVKIGEASIPNSRAGWRSTKRFTVPPVQLSISSSPQLSGHLSTGFVPIRSSARMTGKVELVFIMKKNRATNMNCTMNIAAATNTLTNIRCN